MTEGVDPEIDALFTEEELMHAREVVASGWQLKESGRDIHDLPELDQAVQTILNGLDEGEIRIAERDDDGVWVVNEEYKQAILLSFRLNGNVRMGETYWDKVPLKFDGWTDKQFEASGIRAVPGSTVRRSAYLAPGVIVMFGGDVNVGAYVGADTMVDGGARVGSCAQVGEGVHISGGAGIGGVLEPPQASPTIVEDGVFLGANSEVAEGIIVREGAVIAPGLQLTGSTRIIDRESGETFQGEVPTNAVVIGGSLPVDREQYPNAPQGLTVDCGVIVKYADEQTRSKTSLNDILRP